MLLSGVLFLAAPTAAAPPETAAQEQDAPTPSRPIGFERRDAEELEQRVEDRRRRMWDAIDRARQEQREPRQEPREPR